MNLSDIVKESHNTALSKGWWEDHRTYPEVVMMIITELSESVQEDRSQNINKRNEELADTFIRLCDLIGYLDIDIEAEIRRKMEINKARPYKHGKKY